MSSRDTWQHLRHHDTETNSYRAYYQDTPLPNRLREPSVLIPLLILTATIVYTYSPGFHELPRRLCQFFWDILVATIPARVLYALDAWVNPPYFPRPHMLAAVGQPPSHAAKSDLLRKILGLNTGAGGIISQIGRRFTGFGGGGGGGGSDAGGSIFRCNKGDYGQPAGLGNISNSCYQNSILQGLASLRTLPDYLRMSTADGICGHSTPFSASAVATAAAGMKTSETLRDLIADLNDPSNNGCTLWTPSVLKNMSTWQQQDAQEYFSKLLDEVDGEMAKAAKVLRKRPGLEADVLTPQPSLGATVCGPTDNRNGSTAGSQHSDDSGYQSLSVASRARTAELTSLRNPLEGLIAQRVACVSCGWSDGLSMIPFNCITLSLGMDRSEHDLYERLDAYTRLEEIPGVECGKCTLLKAQRLIKVLIERSRSSHAAGGPNGVNGGKGGKAAGMNSMKQSQRSDDSEITTEAFARLRAIEAALEDDDFDDKTIKQVCKITQKVNSTKTKQAVVARHPQSLVVHVNRSVFDESTGQMFKNSAAVRFPIMLDLGPWCLGSSDRLTAKAPTRANENAGAGNGEANAVDVVEKESEREEEEQWLLDPRSSMVAGDLHPSKITGPIYELRAVVTHYGRHENGHYVCYRKHPRPKTVAPAGPHNKAKNVGVTRRASSVSTGVDGTATATPANQSAAPPNLAADGEDEGSVPIVSQDGKASMDLQNEQPGNAEAAVSSGASLDTEGREQGQKEYEEDSDWWRLSDQNVTRVTEESVLSQGGVFMLFYDCVDPNPVLTADSDAGATVPSSPAVVEPRGDPTFPAGSDASESTSPDHLDALPQVRQGPKMEGRGEFQAATGNDGEDGEDGGQGDNKLGYPPWPARSQSHDYEDAALRLALSTPLPPEGNDGDLIMEKV